MARPSLAATATSDLRQRLAFFGGRFRRGDDEEARRRKKRESSVGQVTIEIVDDADHHHHHQDDGGGEQRKKASPPIDCDTSPSLTISPNSSGASPSSREKTTTPFPPSSLGTATTASASGPLLVTAERSPSQTPTPPEVTLRRKQKAARFESSPTSQETAARTKEVSCSSPTSTTTTTTATTPLPPPPPPSLSYKRISHRRSSSNEVGRLLKASLEKHFSADESDGGKRSGNASKNNNNIPDLDEYIGEVFHQLDYHRSGTISREDFETLCEVLAISSTPPPSYRNSGLEWLTSYRPRPDSPISPLRVDRLGEVKYKKGSSNSSSISSPPPSSSSPSSPPPPPNFLFTLGPRPFWELWPQKKRRKKRLGLDEFKKSLLEQWAKSQGIHPSRVNTVLPVNWNKEPDNCDEIAIKPHKRQQQVIIGGQTIIENNDRETQAKRLTRNIRRLTRRNHFLEKLFRRRGSSPTISSPTTVRCPPGNGVDEVDAGGRADVALNKRIQPPAAQSQQRNNNRNRNFHPQIHLRRRQNRSGSKVEDLEERVQKQQEEISTLRDVIEDLRSSLRLSDAQNLALQVLLKKMAKAETQLVFSPAGSSSTTANNNPSVSNHHHHHHQHQRDSFRSRMDESEKQLEHLVKELKEMSQIRYPRLQQQPSSSHHHNNGVVSGASSSCSTNMFIQPDPLFSLELGELEETLGGAKTELAAAQSELKATAGKLRDVNSLDDAYKALEKAQQELEVMRLELSEAHQRLESTKSELSEAKEELLITQCQLSNSDSQLKHSEKKLEQLRQSRRSLVLELQTTRELLVTSLNKVQDLETDKTTATGTTPTPTATAVQLPTTSKGVVVTAPPTAAPPGQRQQQQQQQQHPPNAESNPVLKSLILSHLRPLSTVDSGLYLTSEESDHEEQVRINTNANKKAPLATFDEDESPPKKPPVSILKTSKQYHHRSATPTSSSSGHHSKSPMPSPNSVLNTSSSSAGSSSGGERETIARLRLEIEELKRKVVASEALWKEERNMLLDELMRRQDYPDLTSDVQILEAQRVRLTLLEDKVKEVLAMLRSLNAMNISSKTLGKLVIDSVERSVDPLSGEIQVFKFLNQLYHSAREYERLSAESQIHRALRAVEAHSETLAAIEAAQKHAALPPITPPRSSSLPPRTGLVRINV